MWRSLAALLAALPAVAGADATAPVDPVAVMEVPRSGELAYRAVIELASEHGCSQSFATSSRRGQLTLAVAGDGRATLRLDLEDRSTFGPSPGRYAAGEKSFSRTRKRVAMEWTGVARRTAGALVVEQQSLRSGEVHLAEHAPGDAPVTLSAPAPASLRLVCEVRPMDVLGAARPDGEHARERLSLLGCQVEPRLPALDLAALSFGRGAGIVLRRAQWAREYEEPKLHRVAIEKAGIGR